MIRITFDLGWAAFVASDQQRCGDAGERGRSRKEESLAGHSFLWLSDKRDDLLGRLVDATTEAGEGQRCAHQFQEGPSLYWIVPLLRVLRILALHKFAELGRVAKLFQATPEVLAVLGAHNAIAH